MLELGDVIGAGLSANEAVPCVFGILAATDADALSAIKMGVNIGNDTDTIATMVGAIVGAMHARPFSQKKCAKPSCPSTRWTFLPRRKPLRRCFTDEQAISCRTRYRDAAMNTTAQTPGFRRR